MRKLILIASIAFLAACSAPQEPQLNFTPQSTLVNTAVSTNIGLSLTSKDTRPAQYVALIDTGRSNAKPLQAKQNIRIAIENAVADQLRAQGYNISMQSSNKVTVSVNEALVKVKHSAMKHQLDAKATLQITAENTKGKIVKTYNATVNRSGAFSASESDIEEVLNDVTSRALAEMANDVELSDYMRERFQ